MSDTETQARAQHLERRLATILCADVAGYSRMMGENEERTVRVFRGHREIFEKLVSQHRGRIFNTAGDALLAEFSSAVEAVRCATDIQSALRTRNEHLAPEERMQFRIGINLGDVILQGGDLLGDGVNVAARIQAATEPGGICISGSVHDQIQDKLSLEFRALGEMSYKNISKPVRTYTITEGAAVTVRPRRSPAKAIGIVAAVLVLAAGGWFAWSQVEAQRTERTRLEAQLAAQKQAAEEARRGAEDARREAQLAAQKQAAEDAVRVAKAERARVEAETKQLEARRLAAAAPAPAVAPAPAPAPRAGTHDGLYSGELCNRPVAGGKQCWPVALSVSRGVVEGSWLSRTRNTSTAKGILTEGAVRLTLQAWDLKGVPIQASMVGRIADGSISASGNWSDGGSVTGEWRKGTFATAPASASSAAKPAAKPVATSGRFEGQVCNRPQNRPEACWPLGLVAKDGVLTSQWKTPQGGASRAEGTLAANGTAQLKLFSFNPRGEPVHATLEGRETNGVLELDGKWGGGMLLRGRWNRGS
jgi:class 3 adenylate cyclase